MKLIAPVLTLTAVLLFSTCSTDFQLESDWEDIPVVYGFLSLQDTAHYIRVEKAFLEPGGNAEAIAQEPDSLYYAEDQITVQLEKIATGQVYTLERVDGNLEGYPREEGPFAQSPNYLYKIKAEDIELEGGDRVRLIINRGDELDEVTAQTEIIEAVGPRSTSPPDQISTWPYNSFQSISWNAGPSAKLFDIRMFIRYRELDPAAPGGEVPRILEWTIQRRLLRTNDDQTRFSVDLLGEDFYRFIGSAIDESVQRERIFESIELQIAAGGQELVELNRVLQANTGITSSQAIPTYTNLSEGRGIFTSRFIATRTGIELTSMALDSLIGGIYTEDLNFRRP